MDHSRQNSSFRRPAPKPPSVNPKRVRGGVKLVGGGLEGATLWAGQRWMRLVEQVAPGAFLAEGLEYAKNGQTKKLSNSAGRVDAIVQGRSDRPYSTTVTLATLTDAQWDEAVTAMAEGAMYAAKLLSGELPTNIEDAFAPRGLSLFPASAADLTVSCTCTDHAAGAAAMSAAPHAPAADPAGGGAPAPATAVDARWCKHVCCVSYLLAQRLATEPFLMFELRGLEGRALLERLRDRRAVTATDGAEHAPIYMQHVPGVVDLPVTALDQSLATFWDLGPSVAGIDLSIERPKVSHPILRRLGPSPFTGAAFPLVGLLASCYDAMSQDALRIGEGEAPAGGEPTGEAPGPGEDGAEPAG